MKTKKLLFTILITCISFIGMSKNNDPLLTVGVEEDAFDMHCAAYIPHILGPSSPLCLNNKYTFKWPHEGPNWSLFLHYEWELVDKYGVTAKKGTTTQSYAILYLNNFTVTQIRVRSVHGYLNDVPNHCKGYWTTLPIKIVRGAIPITSITSEGSFCQGNMKFTALPHSVTHNDYKWEFYFGNTQVFPNLPLPNSPLSKNETIITIPIGYNGTDPIDVFVTPYNNDCGDGYEYIQSFSPGSPSSNPFSIIGIKKPSKYCPGNSNTFRAKALIFPTGVEYKWTFRPINYQNQSLIPIPKIGFDMKEFTPDFGTASNGVGGTVKSYSVELQIRSGCASWSAPITTPWINVSYSNCNYIPGIASSGNNNAKANTFDINIYPNPSTSGIFNINVSGLEGDKTIDVMDLSGKLVYKTSIMDNHSKIDLSNHSKGMYFVKVSDGVHQNTQKIIF